MAGPSLLVLLSLAVLLSSCHANTASRPPHDFLKHSNDLGWLLNAVERDNVAAVVAYDASLGHKPLLVNFAFALQRFGRVRSLLVITANEASFKDCLTLGYSCFNAHSLVAKVPLHGATSGAPDSSASAVQRLQQEGSEPLDQTVEEQSVQQLEPSGMAGTSAASSTLPGWQMLAWARVAVAREALQHNNTLLLTQLDTVYFKDTIRSLLRAADSMDADVILVQDGNQQHGSSSNMLLRPSARTRDLLDAWLAAAAPAANTQKALQALADTSFSYCSSPADCLGAKVKGQAAAWLAPFHGLAGDINTNRQRFPLGLCSSNLLLYQARNKYVRDKISDLASAGLWFVKEDMVSGRFANLTLHHTYYINPAPRYHIRQSRCVLPCPAQLRVAW